jgi:Domain of unknown function (DUF4438)
LTLRTNADALVEVSVCGQVWPAAGAAHQYRATSEGLAAPYLGMAGICFTHRVGDPAFGWEADHLEPCVSMRNPQDGPEHALHYLTCIGNKATVTSGACAGAEGIISGEHAHILADFAPEDIELLAIGDQIQIRAIGAGLQLLDYPDVLLHKCSPRLLDALDVRESDGKLQVPVVMELPSHLMGSGNELWADYVDQDLITTDRVVSERLGLNKLRIGDVVLMRDQNNRWGRGYLQGAVSIGLVIHGDSAWTGHGPGILDLMSSRTGGIEPVINPDANIALTLGIRTAEELAAHVPGALTSSYAEIG